MASAMVPVLDYGSLASQPSPSASASVQNLKYMGVSPPSVASPILSSSSTTGQGSPLHSQLSTPRKVSLSSISSSMSSYEINGRTSRERSPMASQKPPPAFKFTPSKPLHTRSASERAISSASQDPSPLSLIVPVRTMPVSKGSPTHSQAVPALALQAHLECCPPSARGPVNTMITPVVTSIPMPDGDDVETPRLDPKDSPPASTWSSVIKSRRGSLKRRLSTSVSDSSIVELRKLLADEYEDPLTAQKFQNFVLKHEFGDESIQFHNRVQRFKRAPDQATSLSLVREIYEEHLTPNSPGEINIGGNLRENILQEIEQTLRGEDLESRQIDKTLFNEAQGEIERLLYQNSLPKFVRHSIDNLTDDPQLRRVRLVQGVFALLVSVALSITLVLSSISRYARFSVFLPAALCYALFAQYHTKV